MKKSMDMTVRLAKAHARNDALDALLSELKAHHAQETAELRAEIKELRKTIDKLIDEMKSMRRKPPRGGGGKKAELEAELKKLRGQLAKDSSNSSKPPGSDGLKKSNSKNLRDRSGNKPGGQPGHEGKSLEPVDRPDEVVPHAAATMCPCGCSLAGVPAAGHERRQVFDIPPINMVVTEHRAEIKLCPRCGLKSKGVFPPGVDAPVQYGPRVQAHAGYMQGYHLLPVWRTAEWFEDVLGVPVSTGCLAKTSLRLSDIVAVPIEWIKKALKTSKVLHSDDTGVRVDGKTWRLHVFSTPGATYYYVHAKRGAEALDEAGVLKDYHGVIVHDHFMSYYAYGDAHAECNAHILRDLKFLLEERAQAWAGEMAGLLCGTKEEVDRAKALGLSRLDSPTLDTLHRHFDRIVADGLADNPAPTPTPGKRGRPAATPEHNLLRRLRGFKEQILLFAHDFTVPFDNNLAERDLRMTKAKQKISGGFRSEEGAQAWCRLRGFISTARKNGLRVMEALAGAISGNAVFPIRT
jgi:transposase